MLIKGYNHHYRELQKKLFLGATWMLFAHTPDDDDTPATPPAGPSAGVVDAEERKKREKNLEDWKILPKHIQKFYDKDSWFTEQAAKCVPAKQGAYSDEQRADREMVWTDQLKEYNGIQGFIAIRRRDWPWYPRLT